MIHRRIYLFFVFAVIYFAATAQKLNTSPYSYFGIGEDSRPDNVFSAAMGGAGVSFKGGTYLNFVNPAALSSLHLTNFDIAGKGSYTVAEDANDRQHSNIAGLSYLALGFPVYKKLGFMAALQPVTTMGYEMRHNFYDQQGELEETQVFSGEGGSGRFVAALGYELYKGISIGVEGDYYFGNLENSIIDSRKDVEYSTHHKVSTILSGYVLKSGLLYHYEKKDFELNTGLSVEFANNLHAQSDEYLYSSKITGSLEQPHDTLVAQSGIESAIERPLKWNIHAGGGKKNRWYAGVYYEKQDAWNFPDLVVVDNNRVQYTGRYRMGAGGFWVPKFNSLTSYWDRVRYSLGVSYADSGIAVDPVGDQQSYKPVNEFGISFGLGLPVRNNLSQINLGLEYGTKGYKDAGMVRENYFNLRIGLSISEKWFNKNKID